MSISVLPPVSFQNKTFTISHEECELIRKIYRSFGRVAAIRVTRAFAKCDLRTAIEFTREFEL